MMTRNITFKIKEMLVNFVLTSVVTFNNGFIQVHYPVEAIPSIPFSDSKGQLLEAQNAQLRCLLPKSVLNHGFFPRTTSVIRESDEKETVRSCNFSWSGKRKMPTYMNKLVFPEDFMTGLRTIAMQEEEIYKVSAMLEEV
jgi:hypothetical protein